jgi:hypothetical protein
MRRCRYCRAYNIPKNAPKTDAFCSSAHKFAYAMDMVNRSRQKQGKLVKQEDVRRKKEFYEKDYRHQLILTRKAAQRLAVLLDSVYGCISCSTAADVQYCGGHFKTAGAHPELAIDLRNIHKQCNRYCNLALSGNIAGNKNTAGYRAGLVSRYGAEFVEALDNYQDSKRRTCDELISTRKAYNAEIRRLGKGEGQSRNWRELPEQQQAAA